MTVEELREEVELDAARRWSRSSSRTRSTRTPSARRRSAPELMREIERFVILQIVDTRWREHLENMDYLREGVHLRAMAQKDPLVEYRGEGHVMFEELGRRDPRGGRAARCSTSRCSARTPSSCSRPQAPQPLAYEHEIVAGADAIAAAVGGAATALAAPPPTPIAHAAAGRQRAPGRRPQRPLLVRLRQEVQALPRRLAAFGGSRARCSDSVGRLAAARARVVRFGGRMTKRSSGVAFVIPTRDIARAVASTRTCRAGLRARSARGGPASTRVGHRPPLVVPTARFVRRVRRAHRGVAQRPARPSTLFQSRTRRLLRISWTPTRRRLTRTV